MSKTAQFLLSNDIGNSSQKIWALSLDRTPLKPVEFSLDTLGVLMDTSEIPANHPHALALPHAGVYHTRSKEHGARLFKNVNLYEDDLYWLSFFGATAEAIEQVCPDADEILIPVCVVGFPASHISRGEYVRQRLLQGNPWIVQKEGGKEYLVTFKQVVTQSQPYFMLMDQIFTWADGKLIDQRGKAMFANGAVMALDWGASSVDFIVMTSSLKKAQTDCSMHGTISFLPELRKIAYEATHDTIPEYELLFSIYRDKRITWRGVEYDLTEQVNALVASLIPVVVKDVDTFLKQFADSFTPHALYLGGGGVIHAESYLREAFANRFDGGIHVVMDDDGKPEPVRSIARGMGKQAVITYNETLKTHK